MTNGNGNCCSLFKMHILLLFSFSCSSRAAKKCFLLCVSTASFHSTDYDFVACWSVCTTKFYDSGNMASFRAVAVAGRSTASGIGFTTTLFLTCDELAGYISLLISHWSNCFSLDNQTPFPNRAGTEYKLVREPLFERSL